MLNHISKKLESKNTKFPYTVTDFRLKGLIGFVRYSSFFVTWLSVKIGLKGHYLIFSISC